jgi:hypothetical protein
MAENLTLSLSEKLAAANNSVAPSNAPVIPPPDPEHNATGTPPYQGNDAPPEHDPDHNVTVPGATPLPHMAEEPTPMPSDYTKREMEAGKKSVENWNKRRQAELDLGKKLSGRRQ